MTGTPQASTLIALESRPAPARRAQCCDAAALGMALLSAFMLGTLMLGLLLPRVSVAHQFAEKPDRTATTAAKEALRRFTTALDQDSQKSLPAIEMRLTHRVYHSDDAVLQPFSTSPSHRSRRATQQDFTQRVYWCHRCPLAIETRDTSGRMLHFYWSHKHEQLSLQLTASKRQFALRDLIHPYLHFLKPGWSRWQRALDDWGVSPERLHMRLAPETSATSSDPQPVQLVQRMLWEDARHYLVLHAERPEPLLLQSDVGLAEAPLPLVIHFHAHQTFTITEKRRLRFPTTTRLSLNGRLIKEIELTQLRAAPTGLQSDIERRKQAALRQANSQ